jgi:hypothetical protein
MNNSLINNKVLEYGSIYGSDISKIVPIYSKEEL